MDHQADARLLATLEAAHRAQWTAPVEVFSRAPGRVNVLGGHIDYSEGFVLPGAIAQSLYIAASRSSAAGRVRVLATDLGDALGESAEFALDVAAPPVSQREGGPTWLDYFVGPARIFWSSLASERSVAATPVDHPIHHCPFGLDLTVSSDLPMGIGVSSSAALSVAQLLVWHFFAGEHEYSEEPSGNSLQAPPLERLHLARLARRFENEWLGLQCGLMDPYASLFGKPGTVLLLDCRSETHQDVPFPAELTVLVADTGVHRRLANSGFNSRREECLEAAAVLKRRWPALRTLRDVAPHQLGEVAELVPPTLQRRVRHVVTECQRVQEAAAALRDGRLEDFGTAVDASYESSRVDYEVTIPELDTLAHAAQRADGCLGARVSGGGFGGGILAVVRREAAAEVTNRLCTEYRDVYGRVPRVVQVEISSGAELIPAPASVLP